MSDYTHKPVMLGEVLAALDPKTGGRYVDGTVGGGGHASAILRLSSPDGWLCGCDRDGAAIEAARRQLNEFAGRFELRQCVFSELPEWVPARSCDGVLLDLGASSPQFDQAERGFSFQQDGPLDMRMDDRQTVTAARIVNESSAEELARIFREFGDERRSRRAARAIERARENRPLTTTRQLAEVIERALPEGRRRIHPATRVFQALRLAVNDELEQLRRGMPAVWTLLKPGGRLLIITFHSLEARAVKEFGRDLARNYTVAGGEDIPELRRPVEPQLRWVKRRAIQPPAEEVRENPRARSAQLRVMERI